MSNTCGIASDDSQAKGATSGGNLWDARVANLGSRVALGFGTRNFSVDLTIKHGDVFGDYMVILWDIGGDISWFITKQTKQ